MAHTLEVVNSLLELKLLTDEEIHVDAASIQTLYQSLKRWEAIGQIGEISFVRDPADLNRYDYTAELRTGERIDAVFQFAGPDDLDPFLTVIISDPWRLSVFENGQPVRAGLIRLRAEVGIESFTVTFL